MAFAAEPAKQVPRPPGNHIQNASVGEGGLGVFAEVTDARKFENVFNLEGPTVVLPGHQGIEDDNHLFNSLFQTGRARMPVGQGHDPASSQRQTRPTTAHDFIPLLDGVVGDTPRVEFPVSKAQYQDIQDLGDKILQFYDRTCLWLDNLDPSSQGQRVSEEAQRHKAIFAVELQCLLPAICSCTSDEEPDGADPPSPVDKLVCALRLIHSQVDEVLVTIQPMMKPHRSPLARRPGSARQRGLREALRRLERVLRALDKDAGSAIDRVQDLCLVINPVKRAQQSEIEARLRRRDIVSKASSGLVQSIRTACSAHGEHTIWLTLDAAGSEVPFKTACFHISFGCPDDPYSVTSFRVHSTLENPVGPDHPADGAPPSAPRMRRSARLQSTAAAPPVAGSLNRVKSGRVVKRPPNRPASERQDIVIRQLQGEFCLAHYKQREGDSWLSKVAAKFRTPTADHEILYPSSDMVLKGHMPLRQLFTPSTAEQPWAFDRDQKRRVARRIVQAFLQFGSTDWFWDSWDMDNIFVYNRSPDKKRLIYEPIVKTRIPRLVEGRAGPTPIDKEDMQVALGAMIIEVACADRNLVRFMERLKSRDKRVKFREICGRFRLEVAKNLGRDYADIVDDCVNWKLDQGDDQNIFQRTIWEKLPVSDCDDADSAAPIQE